MRAPYLRAAHVQPDGRLIELPDQQMWFTGAELRSLTLRRGDVVVVEGGAGFGRSAVLRQDMGRWGFQNSIVRVRPLATRSEGRFLDYAIQAALRSGEVDSLVSTSTIPHFTAEKVARLPLVVTSLEQQRAIADYLDRETAQIDAFIAKNEALIALLTERRAAAAQSEVEHHVGGGARLKFRLREIDVRAGSSWEKLPLLSVSIHHGVIPREEDPESANESSDLSHYKVAKLGDIVLNRMRAFQGGLGVAPCEGLVSPDYAVLRPADGVDPAWLALVMRTPRFVGEMAMRLRGIGGTDSGAVRTPRISVADLGAILVSVPSVALQSAELQAVMISTERTEKALMVAQRSVELARERRAALISAAVTGKIDVGVAR